jgi:hypothetical protein
MANETAVNEMHESPVKTETRVDWGMIGIFALVENLVLGLIGWLAYIFWKKRRSGRQDQGQAVENQSSERSEVENATANPKHLETEQTLASESDLGDESINFDAGAVENQGDEVLFSDDNEQAQPESESAIEDMGLSDLDDVQDTTDKAAVEETLDISSDELLADFDQGAEENESASSPADGSAMDSDETDGQTQTSPDIDLSADDKEQDSAMSDALIDELLAGSQGADDQPEASPVADLSTDKEESNSSIAEGGQQDDESKKVSG